MVRAKDVRDHIFLSNLEKVLEYRQIEPVSVLEKAKTMKQSRNGTRLQLLQTQNLSFTKTDKSFNKSSPIKHNLDLKFLQQNDEQK